MKHLHLVALVGAVTFLGTTAVTFAQPQQQPAPAQTEKLLHNIRAIKIKNVPAALIAYQLDPKHNARPTILGDVKLAPSGASREEEKGAFTLPGDIEQITSVDAQNVILVAGGSQDDIRRLEELIDVLDQPLLQIEIQAQFIEIDTDDLNQFGIDFGGEVKVGFVRGNFTAKLDKLIAEGSAKVVSAPRVITIDNMTAIMDAAMGPTNGKAPTWAYNVTPIINSNGTVTILFQSEVKPVEKQRDLETVVNIRDGDTIAFQQEKVPQTADATTAAQTNLVFFTARIIRRADEKTPDPKKYIR